MSDRDLSKRGLSISKPPEVDRIVDQGWGFVPGATDRTEILKSLPTDLQKLVKTEAGLD